jgi:hypothetical protein
MQSIKEHNLKANHNASLTVILKIDSVCNLSKNTPDSYRSENKSQRT